MGSRWQNDSWLFEYARLTLWLTLPPTHVRCSAHFFAISFHKLFLASLPPQIPSPLPPTNPPSTLHTHTSPLHTLPPHTHSPPMGGSLSSRRLCKICRYSMKQNPLKCKGVWKVRGWNPKKIYPLGWKTLCLGKQKFASEFFCPWHNVSTQKEHIFYPDGQFWMRII